MNSRIDTTEEIIGELKDIDTETTQNRTQRITTTKAFFFFFNRATVHCRATSSHLISV